jgi:hypothetical protein
MNAELATFKALIAQRNALIAALLVPLIEETKAKAAGKR